MEHVLIQNVLKDLLVIVKYVLMDLYQNLEVYVNSINLIVKNWLLIKVTVLNVILDILWQSMEPVINYHQIVKQLTS